jgi:outer membrane protein TolC
MKFVMPFVVLATVPVFSGCLATAGSRTYSASLPSYERTASAAAASDHSSALTAAVLERDAFVRAVLARNPSVESARQGWRAALARVRQAGAFEDPMLDVAIAPLSIAGSSARFGFELGLSQRVPWFGKRDREAGAAAAESQAAHSNYAAMKLDLALAAVTLYDQYFVIARAIEINAQHGELLRELHAATLAQFQSGRASAQDPLQAESELLHLEHDAVLLASEHDVTLAQMNDLLHRAPELPLPPPPQELPPISTEVRPLDARQLAEQAAQRRPEIAATQQQAQAQQARAERAELESYPDLTLSTSYNSMWDMAQHRWMVGVGLNLPIQTERRAAAADEARAMSAQFSRDAERLSDAARTRVFIALKQLQESQHISKLYEERFLPLARDQVSAARTGFITSQNPFMAVVEAEKNLRALELDYQKARAEQDRHQGELEIALGRIPGLSPEETER